MNERYASVWDALPADLRDTEAMMPECNRLADRLGFDLVLAGDWWHLSAPGIRCRFGDLADVAGYLRKAAKRALPGLAGADCTVALDLPANALQAVFKAMPIETSHWTVDAENATRPRYTNELELSNES